MKGAEEELSGMMEMFYILASDKILGLRCIHFTKLVEVYFLRWVFLISR